MHTYAILEHGADQKFEIDKLATIDLFDAAEICAADFHSQHDGWECEWPLTFIIYRDGVELGRLLVHRDTEPVFNAYSL